MTDEPTPVAIWPVWWQQIVSSQRREARRLVAELIAVRGVMPLLMKARNGGRWTAGEKQELLVHLRRMALLSPYLPALLLPGSMLLLPLSMLGGWIVGVSSGATSVAGLCPIPRRDFQQQSHARRGQSGT